MSNNVKQINNNEPKINSLLFDKARLQKGLSRMGLALEAEVAPQTVNRLLQGKPTRPSHVKKVGEALGMSAQDWYISITEKGK